MTIKIDHVAIAVNNLEESIKLYAELLGLKVEEIEIETVEEQKVRIAMFPLGESKIELVESTEPEGQIAKYIEKKGEGIHHVAIEVKNIQDMLKTLKEKGIPLIDMEPQIGAGGSRIAFLHPKATKALIELVEH